MGRSVESLSPSGWHEGFSSMNHNVKWIVGVISERPKSRGAKESPLQGGQNPWLSAIDLLRL